MIDVRDLDFSYDSSCKILNQISFDAHGGECIAVLGNNGAGKSTLIKCLNKILQPQHGSVLLDGSDLHRQKRQDIARQVAYVSQKNVCDSMTVFDCVLLGRKPYIKLNAAQEDLDITESVIERMGLKRFEMRYIDELSGGELQKVMLARALAQQPKVLLLDEPTSNLDLRNQYEVLSIVRKLAKSDGICVIIVIHDLNLALRFCDRFLFVKDCKVFAYGGQEAVTAETIREVYGMDVVLSETLGVRTVVPMLSIA